MLDIVTSNSSAFVTLLNLAHPAHGEYPIRVHSRVCHKTAVCHGMV
jgi:hypothetical protein